jgi:hypothetical protein
MFAQVFPAERIAEPLDLVRRAVCTVGWRLRETACAVRGHDYLLHHANRRLCLRCVVCGHETPGWLVASMAERRSGDSET